MLVTIKHKEKYFYLVNQDIKHMFPYEDDVQVRLKDGSTLIIQDVTTKELDQLLMSGKYETLNKHWRLADENVSRNRIGM